MSFIARFCNGDFVQYGHEQIIYYRKHLLSPKNYGYINSFFHRGDTLDMCPMYRMLDRGFEAMCSQQSLDASEALRYFLPMLEEKTYDGNRLTIVSIGRCPKTGQALVKFRALERIVFQHPKHPGDGERTYVVEKDTVSGWMDENSANYGTWVDESSSLSGFAAHSLITRNSKVVGSDVTLSWIRSSVVDHSNIKGSIIQQSNVLDSDVIDSGLRSTTVEEASIEKTSVNGGNCGVVTLKESRLQKTELVNSVAIKSVLTDVNSHGGHFLDCEVATSKVHDSFIKNHRVTDGIISGSTLSSDRVLRELPHALMVNNGLRIETLHPHCILIEKPHDS